MSHEQPGMSTSPAEMTPEVGSSTPTGPAFIAIMLPSPDTSKRWWSMYCRECGIEEGMADTADDPRLILRRDEHNRTAHTPTDDEREALGAIWDDGNAVGLDGWIGPGRGAGEVDDHAVRCRERAIEKYASAARRTVQSEPSERTAEFEAMEVDLYKHQPVLSMEDGTIAGCACMDRVFYRNSGEDWGTHLAEIVEAEIANRARAWHRTHCEVAFDLTPDQSNRREERCPKCGGLNGSHHIVHTRHGNGGGWNGPCPNHPEGGA